MTRRPWEEDEELEAQLRADGECRIPLVVWKEENTLVDGHRRRKACKKLSIRSPVERKSFPSRDAALAYMIQLQSARRNLPPNTVAYFRGKKYRIEKRQGTRTDLTSGQSDEKLTTATAIAVDQKVSGKTVRPDAEFAHYVDTLAQNAGPVIRTKILCGDLKLSRNRLKELATEDPDEQKRLVGEALASIGAIKRPGSPGLTLETKRHSAWESASYSRANGFNHTSLQSRFRYEPLDS